MTLTIPDEIVPIIDFQFLGTISSAFAYGIVFILSGNCIYLLQTKRGIYSNRMRIFLLIYIIAMFLASTWALIRWTCEFMYWITILPRQLLNFPIELPLVIWGADGFMVSILILLWEQRFTMQLQIWRCVILYQNVSKGPRIVIIVLLSLLSFASFGRLISISTPLQFKLLTKIMSLRCDDVSRRTFEQASAGRPSVHFTLHFRQYYTRSVDRFTTRLLSKTCPKCPWSGTWISLHQHYHHVRRIFSTDGHC